MEDPCKLTKCEGQRLHTILWKLEYLQNITKDERAAERMGKAKRELLRILNPAA